ncbi:MAG: ArsR/SmtB family transcription factor [Deferribacterales bacterium]
MSKIDNTVEMIKAIADKNRLRIMLMLSERPLCVCEIDSVLGIALSTISSHLKQMRSAGVIESEKEGRWVVYHPTADPLVRSIISDIKKQLSDDAEVKSDMAKIKTLCREECAKNLK